MVDQISFATFFLYQRLAGHIAERTTQKRGATQ
jgi:hypothetical protein